MDKTYLTADEAAAYLGLSPSYLAKLRMGTSAVTGPCYYRVGPRAIRYRVSDLDQWMASKSCGDVRAFEGRRT